MVLDTASRVSEETKLEALDTPSPSPEREVSGASPNPGVSRAESEARDPARGERAQLLPPELLSLLWKVIPALWLLAAIAAGVTSGPPLLFLVLAAGALALVVTLMWSSVQSLTGGTPLGFEEALGMGAPSKVEEEKRAVLRALKDLEYERSVGKISPEDYAELSARYRTEAKRLMQSLDESLGPARQEVEKAIAERLARAGVPAPEPASTAGADAALSGNKPVEMAEKRAEAQPEPPKEAS
jgi:hypothetical protein